MHESIQKNTRRKLEAQEELDPKQIAFAEWLCMPPWERSPNTIKELADQLDVTRQTVNNWKKLPEVIHLVNAINAERLNSLVAPATALLERAIEHPGSVNRVSFDAARYIVQDWGKKTQLEGDITRTLVDLYKKYNMYPAKGE